MNNISSIPSTEPYEGRVTQYAGGLRFNKVTRDDSGEYVCSVAGNGHSDDVLIKLVVLGNVPLDHFIYASFGHWFASDTIIQCLLFRIGRLNN